MHIAQDSRSKFYRDYISSDEVGSDLRLYMRGDAYKGLNEGTGLQVESIQDGIVDTLSNPGQFIGNSLVSLYKSLPMYSQNDPIGFFNTQVDRANGIVDGFNHWQSLDERAALEVFHGMPVQGGMLLAENTISNANASVAFGTAAAGGIGTLGRGFGVPGDNFMSRSPVLNLIDLDADQISEFSFFDVDTSGMPREFVGPNNNQLSIGAGRRDGESLFNPAGSGDNCVNGVCAFLNTMETGNLHTASPHVAHNGGSIPVALKQIAEQTGAKVGSKSSAQFSTLNTARDRQFFIVFQGPDFEVSNHVAVGIVNKGNKVIFDPQTGTTFKSLSDWNKKGGGSFTSFPLLLKKQQ